MADGPLLPRPPSINPAKPELELSATVFELWDPERTDLLLATEAVETAEIAIPDMVVGSAPRARVKPARGVPLGRGPAASPVVAVARTIAIPGK